MAAEQFDAWVRDSVLGSGGGAGGQADDTDTASGLARAIYERWCTAVAADLRTESEWLAEVSHSLQRVERSRTSGNTIG